MPYDFQKLEAAAMDFARRATRTFSTSDAAKVLAGIVGTSPSEEPELIRESAAIFESDIDLFPTEDLEIFEPKNGFFNGSSFLVTPSEYEIEKGILFPGHRFIPFCCTSVFPSEVTISCDKEKITKCEYKVTHADAVMYHSLIGMYEMVDFFIAEHPANADAAEEGDGSAEMILTVFDMKNFYSSKSFRPGDALLVSIDNWADGIFSFSYLPIKERDMKSKNDWVTKLEVALESVFDRFGSYIEIPEQFAQAFHIDKSLIEKPDTSIDEFIHMTEKVQITLLGSQTILAPAMDEASGDEEDSSIPDNVFISSGKTGSLQEILDDLGSPLKQVEVEAYMLDELYNAGTSFDAFCERCFPVGSLSFADDAQEAIFMNYLEDIWERRGEIYNRFDDDKKGLVRAKVLEIVDERNQWLAGMKEDSVNDDVVKQKIEPLADSSARLRKLLEMLNSEDYAIDESEMQNIVEAVEDMAEIQSKLIGSAE